MLKKSGSGAFHKEFAMKEDRIIVLKCTHKILKFPSI